MRNRVSHAEDCRRRFCHVTLKRQQVIVDRLYGQVPAQIHERTQQLSRGIDCRDACTPTRKGNGMHSEACSEIEYEGSANGRQLQRLNLGATGLQRGLGASGHPNIDRGEVMLVVCCCCAHVVRSRNRSITSLIGSGWVTGPMWPRFSNSTNSTRGSAAASSRVTPWADAVERLPTM